MFLVDLKLNLSQNKLLRFRILFYILLTLRSKWADFLSLNPFKNLAFEELSYVTAFKFFKINNNNFVQLKPKVFSNSFKTLRRTEPFLSPVKENSYNQMITDFDNSVDKINQLKLFKSFLKVNATLGFTNFTPHMSQRSIFIKYYKRGVAFSSIPRFYAAWTNSYNLIFNIIFYKIEILTFGNSFFKNEILALNWNRNGKMNTFWRYVKPFLIYQSVKINDYGDFIFRNLNNMGYYIGLILDIAYHKKTIYYLRKSKFYVIGIVPSNYDIKSVDAALPIINDTIPNQLFFIRLILLIKKNVKTYYFKELKSFWFGKNDICIDGIYEN